MKRKHVMMVWLAFVALSCNDSESDEVPCENYYLATISEDNGKFIINAYYNDAGLISEYIQNNNDTLVSFKYNADNQLISRHHNDGKRRFYYFYENKRLKYFLSYYDIFFTDSTVVEYNNQNLISDIYYWINPNWRVNWNTKQLSKRSHYEYVGKNSSTVSFYELGENNGELKLSSSTQFEYDNKKRPFPSETYPFYFLFDNGSIAENNVIRQIRDGRSDSQVVYSYEYNIAGYPTLMRLDNTVLQKYTYTCQPQLRN